MKLHHAILIWLTIVVLFVAYGLFFSDSGWSATWFYGGVGFTTATCLSVSIYFFAKMKAGLINGFNAIILVLFYSVVAAFAPPFAMKCSGLFEGEAALGTISVAGITFTISVFVFMLFDVAVLLFSFRRRYWRNAHK